MKINCEYCKWGRPDCDYLYCGWGHACCYKFSIIRFIIRNISKMFGGKV
jgi:hypothetical protein